MSSNGLTRGVRGSLLEHGSTVADDVVQVDRDAGQLEALLDVPEPAAAAVTRGKDVERDVHRDVQPAREHRYRGGAEVDQPPVVVCPAACGTSPGAERAKTYQRPKTSWRRGLDA